MAVFSSVNARRHGTCHWRCIRHRQIIRTTAHGTLATDIGSAGSLRLEHTWLSTRRPPLPSVSKTPGTVDVEAATKDSINHGRISEVVRIMQQQQQQQHTPSMGCHHPSESGVCRCPYIRSVLLRNGYVISTLAAKRQANSIRFCLAWSPSRLALVCRDADRRNGCCTQEEEDASLPSSKAPKRVSELAGRTGTFQALLFQTRS
ncbi:hypothetical protein B0T17DRAFT_510503 [Bombardia bombarda]|uniref:Uncharacterized protein n=1 Tax=Bombardia bombarda TaxID=252184 RepID=A0AA39WIB8_9PEZI|nr:hypothetical protein B0T17DRAFT_510503 [Bombardia bombarda]